MKNVFRSMLLVMVLSSCAPSLDIGSIAQNAANQAVESAVESAVDSLIRRTVDRIVANVFDLFIASAIDSMFGVGAEVEYGDNFALDIYTGKYTIDISGDAPLTGEFRFDGGEPTAGQEDFSLGVAIRGSNEEDKAFTTLALARVGDNDADSFTLTLVEGEDDLGERLVQVGIQFADSDIVYVGEASLSIDTLSNERFVGSFIAQNLTSEDDAAVIAVSASFDVPINPVGSLFFKSSLIEN